MFGLFLNLLLGVKLLLAVMPAVIQSIDEDQATCLEAHRHCVAQYKCGFYWDFFNSSCRGTDCLRDSDTESGCNAGYNTLVGDGYLFKNCRCNLTNLAECLDIQTTVLKNPCRTVTLNPDQVMETPHPVTCAEAEKACINNPTCTFVQGPSNGASEVTHGQCTSGSGNDCGRVDHCTCRDNDTCGIVCETMNRAPCVAICRMNRTDLRLSGGINRGESTCSDAVTRCSSDDTCNHYFSQYLSACMVDTATGQCHRDQCMRAWRDIFTFVSPEMTHAMVFCHCEDHDAQCHGIRAVLSPQCATELQAPVESCLSVKRRCKARPCCNASYQSMLEHCVFRDGDCVGKYSACRTALIGALGAPGMSITGLCSCAETGPAQGECMRYADLMQGNPCIEKASRAYFMSPSDGCVVHSLDQRHGALIPTGRLVKVYGERGNANEACLCADNGTLINCVSILFLQDGMCDYEAQNELDTQVLIRPSSNPCLCSDGNVVCLNQSVWGILDRTQAPMIIVVAYSQKETAGANGVLDSLVTPDTVAKGLEDVLEESYHLTRCHLIRVWSGNGIIAFKPDGECNDYEYVLSLGGMINNRDPRIDQDLLLSVVKEARVVSRGLQGPLSAAVGSRSNSMKQWNLLVVGLSMYATSCHCEWCSV